MKKIIYLLLFLSFKTIYSQVGSTPGCEAIPNVCLVHNSNQNINGVQIGNSFYLSENCTTPALKTWESSSLTSQSISHIQTNLPFCDFEFTTSTNGKTKMMNQLHWSGQMTLEYFSTKYPTNELPIAPLNRNIYLKVDLGNNHILTNKNSIFDFTNNYFGNDITHPSLNNVLFIAPHYYYKDANNVTHYFEDNLDPINYPISLDYIGTCFTRIFITDLFYKQYPTFSPSFTAEHQNVLASYAEIFGVLIEFYAEGLYDTNKNGDWLIGEDFVPQIINNGKFEDFANPNNADHPKYYQGQYWNTNTSNEYIINASIQNHWFYLLTEGGTGLNEVNQCYDINGVGKDKAADIVYRALSQELDLLNPTFENSKNATIQAATDLYGANSPELASVIAAWQAVGVLPSASSISPLPTNSYTTINSPAEINGTFTIPYGAQLIVNNTTLTLGHNAEIIIQDGGSLRIDNSTVNLGQNASIEKQAGLGYFKTDNSTYQYGELCPAATNFPFWGGVKIFNNPNDPNAIEITNCTFTQSADGIDLSANQFKFNGNEYIDNLKPLYIHDSGPLVNNNYNTIYNCDFKITSNIFNTNQSKYNFIRVQNADLRIGRHVSGHILAENTFTQENLNYKVEAIICENFTFSQIPKIFISGNHFYSCNQSITNIMNLNLEIYLNEFHKTYRADAAITNILVKDANIYRNWFYDIARSVYSLASNVEYNENSFFIPSASNVLVPNNQENYGVFNIGTRGTIQRNRFNIDGHSSFGNGGVINAYAMIFDNCGSIVSEVFSNQIGSENLIGIQTQGNNSGVKIKCNRLYGNILIPFLIADGTIHDMGANCSGPTNQQAGNEFYFNNGFNGIIVKGNNAADFDYWAHKELYTGAQVTVPNDLWFNGASAPNRLQVCDGNDAPSGQIQNPYPIRIKDNLACVLQGSWKPIGGGNVSNTVLNTEIADRTIKKQALIAEHAGLDNSLLDPDTQKEVVRRMDALQKEITYINIELVDLYEEAGNTIAAKNLLENASSIESKMVLLEKYTEAGEFANADRVRLELDLLYKEDFYFESYSEESDYDDNKTEFVYLDELKNLVRLDSRNLTQLSENEKLDLEMIKSKDLPVSALAEAILILNGDSLVTHEIRKIPIPSINEVINAGYNIDTFEYQLSVAPNPINNIMNITYVLPTSSSNATIKIIDQYNNFGTQVYSISLSGNQTNYQINVSAIPNGNYLVSLQVGDDTKTSKHILIQR